MERDANVCRRAFALRTWRRVALLSALRDFSRPLIGQSHPLRAILRNGVFGQHRDLSELACVDLAPACSCPLVARSGTYVDLVYNLGNSRYFARDVRGLIPDRRVKGKRADVGRAVADPHFEPDIKVQAIGFERRVHRSAVAASACACSGDSGGVEAQPSANVIVAIAAVAQCQRWRAA